MRKEEHRRAWVRHGGLRSRTAGRRGDESTPGRPDRPPQGSLRAGRECRIVFRVSFSMGFLMEDRRRPRYAPITLRQARRARCARSERPDSLSKGSAMHSNRPNRNPQQVRSIIQSLGRSIDEARTRRLGPSLPNPTEPSRSMQDTRW
ncbi:MAG: hypothetical protein ACK56F_13785, partial [bacterium]